MRLSPDSKTIGFALSIATLLLYLKGPFVREGSISSLPFDILGNAQIELTAFLLTGALTAFVCFTIEHRANPAAFPNPSFIACSILSSACLLGSIFRVFSSNTTATSALACGVLAGASSALLLSLWCSLMHGRAKGQLLFDVSIAICLAMLISACISAYTSSFAAGILWSICQIASVFLVAVAMKRPEEDSSDVEDPERPQERKRLFAIGAGALCVGAFHLGACWKQGEASSSFGALFDVAAAVLVAMAFFFILNRTKNTSNALYVCRMTTIVASVILLADPFLIFLGSQMNAASSILWPLSISMLWSAGWTLAPSSIDPSKSGFSSSAFAGTALLMLCAAVGMYAQITLDPGQIKFASSIILVVYLISTALSSSALSAGNNDEPLDKAHRIAQHYGLTPREEEVCSYLIEGHGASFIGQKLYLSPGTIKTHRRNIYRKLGINSREELLELARNLRR